jgi:5'-nucleotidase
MTLPMFSMRQLCGALAAIVASSVFLAACSSDDEPAREIKVKLVAFNDLHGHLGADTSGSVTVNDPTNPTATVSIRAGGATFLATKVKELRAQNPNTFVISTGDAIGASPLTSALFRDEPTFEAMNAMGVDVNVVGNHEFDKGRAELDRMVKGGCAPAGGDPNLSSCAVAGRAYTGARFATLAANVVDSSNRPVYPAYLIKEYEGVKIGVIGVVTRTTPTIVIPTGIQGLSFLDEAQTINRYVAELKSQNVETIIALIHEGGQTDSTYNDQTCANARGEVFSIVDKLDAAVDVVFSGHTHQAYNCVRRGINVIQGSSFGKLVSEVDIVIDSKTRDVIKAQTRARNVPVPNNANTAEINAKFPPLAADATVADITRVYTDLAGPKVNRQVGSITATIDRTASPGGDHAAGRLIADAQFAATRAAEFGNATIAFMNPGGVRADFVFAGTGAVTFGQAFTVQPFGNSLVTMTLTGAQLKELLEQQFSGVNAARPRILQPSTGFVYSWDNNAAAGSKVVAASMLLNGQAIVATQNYRVTVNSFLADGGDGFSVLTQGTQRLGGAQDIDALIDYFAKNSPIAPIATARVTRVN